MSRSSASAPDSLAARNQLDWLHLTHASTPGPLLNEWQRRAHSRLGRWLFARSLWRRAPYLRILRPRLLELRPALCRVALASSKHVRSSEGTVHSAALSSLCELGAALVTEVTLPWKLYASARGLSIEYLQPARSDVTATARLDKSEWLGTERIAVPVSLLDSDGAEVARGVVSLQVAPG